MGKLQIRTVCCLLLNLSYIHTETPISQSHIGNKKEIRIIEKFY